MEIKQKSCQLCSKVFANGRALGAHMKFHFAILAIPPKTQQQKKQIGEEPTESISPPAPSYSEEDERGGEEEEEEDNEEKALTSYGLREKPKKSFRLVDPEFLDAESVVQQDGEIERESRSRKSPTRRQTKRTRKVGFGGDSEVRGLIKKSPAESAAGLEQVMSSVSETFHEADVALCLMMLSRDTRRSPDELKPSQTRRASPKKVKRYHEDDNEDVGKIHRCSICDKVFGSGQALGGHKRSHFVTSLPAKIASKSAKVSSSTSTNLADEEDSAKYGDFFIDLNLPAPMEDDGDHEEDYSQPEVSAVLDPECIAIEHWSTG